MSKRSRILVIDDDEVLLATTEALLAAAGFDVSTHIGPFGASLEIVKHRPDLVLLDVDMPGLKGPDLTDIVRSNTWCDAVRILYYSSSDEAVLQALVQETGADGFIRKGDRTELREKIETALAG